MIVIINAACGGEMLLGQPYDDAFAWAVGHLQHLFAERVIMVAVCSERMCIHPWRMCIHPSLSVWHYSYRWVLR